MSVNKNVLLECDGRDGARVCRAAFAAASTSVRVTREAAESEGWSTGMARADPDYCPRHAGHQATVVAAAPVRSPMWGES